MGNVHMYACAHMLSYTYVFYGYSFGNVNLLCFSCVHALVMFTFKSFLGKLMH